MNIRMSTKGKRPLRSLTPSDKIHAIQRIHDGESKASVARDIGVPESTLRGWCKNEDKLRFMSRQSHADKMASDSLTDKLDAANGLLGAPAEKRAKMDGGALPLNYSSKLNYDEMTYKRAASLNGLGYGAATKALTELTFNGLPPEYVGFNGTGKNKVFGADISRQMDPSIAAISPLNQLSHLSGLNTLAQSPLAISFSELTSNLNLLAQLNPGLAAMTSLSGLTAQANTISNVKAKTQSHNENVTNDLGERSERTHGLSVKNWAKQPTPSPGEASYGMNLSQNETKSKMKCPSPAVASSLGANIPTQSALSMSDDPFLYWFKTQQALLGLSNLYPPASSAVMTNDTNSPPLPTRSSTPQTNHTPTIPTSLTQSATPSINLDDKNAAWFNWYKALGASLNSLTPAAVAALHANALQQQPSSTSANMDEIHKATLSSAFENILYSQLTKDVASSSGQSNSSADQQRNAVPNGNKNNNNNKANYKEINRTHTNATNKPEDLSSKSVQSTSQRPTPAQSPVLSDPRTPATTPAHSPALHDDTEAALNSDALQNGNTGTEEALNSLLNKLNNNDTSTASLDINQTVNGNADNESESDNSYHNHSDHSHSHNNNNNSNKTDEEERIKGTQNKKESSKRNEEDGDCDTSVIEGDADIDADAIKHGEKFLQWLENCSNPRVTSVQLMQLRCLIASIKSGNSDSVDDKFEEKNENDDADADTSMVDTTENAQDTSIEESCRNKTRRRK